MAEDFDFNTIVADAARRIENRTGVIVNAEARQVLLSRALEHRSDVARAVAEQGLTASDLVDAAERQLQEAVPYIDQPRRSEQQQQQPAGRVPELSGCVCAGTPPSSAAARHYPPPR